MTASSGPAVHRAITSHRLKSGIFLLEGANSIATTYFFYYIYFFTRDKFHFDTGQNFLLASGLGVVYTVSSILGGRYAQKVGYLSSFRLGVAIMFTAFLWCSQASRAWVAIALIAIADIGMCLTWPALEAAMSEGEPRARLRGFVGTYNVTWAVTSAFAFFTGGAMQKAWGLQAMFFVPAALLALEFIFALWLEKQINRQPEIAPAVSAAEDQPSPECRTSPVPPQTFLKMAWLANPFAYVCINTILASLPALADRLHLGKSSAGVLCSVWLFARAAAFILLALWSGWHYRFRFLAGAYAAMILGFAAMLLAPGLAVLVMAQILLGAALGLMYHSSLFYSMDVGETKGEHGGLHEAAIGAGGCGGPAVAAIALHFFPANPASSPLAVSLLLCAGLGGLCWMRFPKSSQA